MITVKFDEVWKDENGYMVRLDHWVDVRSEKQAQDIIRLIKLVDRIDPTSILLIRR